MGNFYDVAMRRGAELDRQRSQNRELRAELADAREELDRARNLAEGLRYELELAEEESAGLRARLRALKVAAEAGQPAPASAAPSSTGGDAGTTLRPSDGPPVELTRDADDD